MKPSWFLAAQDPAPPRLHKGARLTPSAPPTDGALPSPPRRGFGPLTFPGFPDVGKPSHTGRDTKKWWKKIQVSTFLLHHSGHAAADRTRRNTPPSREFGAAVRPRKKITRAPPASSNVSPRFRLPNPLSFLTLLNKGGLILHGLAPASAELVQSPAISGCARLAAVGKHHGEDQAPGGGGVGDLLGRTFTPLPTSVSPTPWRRGHDPSVVAFGGGGRGSQSKSPSLRCRSFGGGQHPTALLPALHPSVGTGLRLRWGERAEPPRPPLFPEHAPA